MPRLKTFLIILFLILIFEPSSCQTQNGDEPAYLQTEIYSKKAFQETTQDYENGGPNPKHDPTKKGKPGSGGKT